MPETGGGSEPKVIPIVTTRLIQTVCPVCGADSATVLLEVDGRRELECPNQHRFTETEKEQPVHDDVRGMAERDGIRVELAWIGEGYDGDYDATNPDDEPLLRFTVLAGAGDLAEAGEFAPLENGSYCTVIPASIKREWADVVAHEILRVVAPLIDKGESVKEMCEALSHLDGDEAETIGTGQATVDDVLILPDHNEPEFTAAPTAGVAYDTIGAEHLGLKEFASKDGTRPFITGLFIQNGMAAVTDGAILMTVPTAKEQGFPIVAGMGKPLARSVIIPFAGIDKALRLVGKPSYGVMQVLTRVAVSEVEDDTVVGLSATDLEVGGTLRARVVQGQFPNVLPVIPKRKERPFNVTISATLLKRLAAYVEKYGDGGAGPVPLTFYFDPSSSLSAIRVEFPLKDERRTAVGALAPLRTYGGDGRLPLPAYLAEIEQEENGQHEKTQPTETEEPAQGEDAAEGEGGAETEDVARAEDAAEGEGAAGPPDDEGDETGDDAGEEDDPPEKE